MKVSNHWTLSCGELIALLRRYALLLEIREGRRANLIQSDRKAFYEGFGKFLPFLSEAGHGWRRGGQNNNCTKIGKDYFYSL